MDRRIIGLKLTKKGADVRYSETVEEHGEETSKEHTSKISRKPSGKLTTLLHVLLGHALVWANLDEEKIGEKELGSRKIVDMPKFKGWDVKGFSVSGSGENETLSIDLLRTNLHGTEFKFKVDKIPVQGGYQFDTILGADLSNLVNEVKLFIEGENYWVQGNLFAAPKEENKSKEKSNRFDQF